jgi:hypothetical protein
VDEQTIRDAVENQWVACIRIAQKEAAARAALNPNVEAPAPNAVTGEAKTTACPGEP